MHTGSFLVALGLTPVLIVNALASPQGHQGRPPNIASAQTGKGVEAPQGPLRPNEVRQRTEAQAQAQLRLLELQKRQLEEQVHDLEEQEREQIEQLKAEANRQVEQVRRQAHRQIEQVRQQVKRQVEVLEAQMKLVEALGGIRSEASRALRQTDQPGGRILNPETRRVQPAVSPSLEEKLDKILDRLERVEKRLDRLEKAR